MREIRTKEKVKDIKIIDRAQTAASHMKKGYVRTKEQFKEDQQETANPSGYAAEQAEKEMCRAGNFAAGRAFPQGRKGIVTEGEENSGGREREGRFSEESEADAGIRSAERGRQDIWQGNTLRDAEEKETGVSGQQKAQNEIRENKEFLQCGKYEAERMDRGESHLIKDGGSSLHVRKEPPYNRYGRTAQVQASPSQSQVPLNGVPFHGKNSYRQERSVREREKAERYIKEPAHGTEYQNRPQQKYSWGRHEKRIRTSEVSAERFWYRQHSAAYGQHAFAAEYFPHFRQRNVTSAGRTLADVGKRAGMGIRGAGESVKAAFTGSRALAGLLASGGGAAVFIVLVTALFGGIFLTSMGNSPEGAGQNVSQEVIAYTPLIRQYAQQYGIPAFVGAIQAMMMQESGGQGTDPMQSSECPYNIRFPNTPGAITEPEYSIAAGIQYFASCLEEAGCESPFDIEKLSLAWQGYNYGNGYITWAVQNFGGYSQANAQVFSEQQAASHGWSAYGDPQYVPHVMRYYQYSGDFFPGDNRLVDVARTQIGNQGGQPYWSWFGFNSRVPWCACFVSWCADQCGYLESGILPKFAACDDGISWFREKGLYFTGAYVPKAGDLVFFDWDMDGTSDHVGIVAAVEGGSIHTIEGNTSDSCAERTYLIGDWRVCGFGSAGYSGMQ